MTTRLARLYLGTAAIALATTALIGCSKPPEAAAPTPAPATTVGTKVDDTVITSSVKSALMGAPGIKSLDISVATVNGEVQLSGTVDGQGQIDEALKIARATDGATSVKNNLRIKS